MSEGKEKRKIPKVRFPSFTDDWEQRKFSEIAQRESTAKKSSTDFPSVEYEDVVSEVGILNKDVRLKETQKTGIGFDGSQVLYGKLRPYLHNWLSPDFCGVAVGDWWVLKPVNVDKSFLFRLIQTEKFDDIANQSSGSKMPRADWNLLSNTEFMVPAEIEEERKIGQYFSELDHLITLHQRKLDDLKELKKGMRQRLFPKDGKNIPDLRFPGFNGAWERHTLNDVAKYRNGKAHENDIDAAGAYVVVNSKFVSTNGAVQKFSNKQIEPLFKNEIAFVLSDVPNGRAIARTFLVDKDNTYTLNQRIAGITPLKNADPYFLYILMNRNPYFLKFDDGVKQTNLSVKDVMQFVSFYPTYEEQKIIGKYFENLDNLLLLQQKKINDLLELKKGLLQQMFV
ncbi:restriction endonuclease subunit S [Lactimicrobium massiliense]|uniref:restriction endonuclease subunit S n=1 Tax=Lactimicrobium massiliense TaxID=2161814 RepID=UPI001AE479E3|nr:restriction endonuclease subunit S [Lactimicrobium massiliense]